MPVTWNLALKLGLAGLVLWLLGMVVLAVRIVKNRGVPLFFGCSLASLLFVSVALTLGSQFKFDVISKLSSGGGDDAPSGKGD
jgi:hypothetical protein